MSGTADRHSDTEPAGSRSGSVPEVTDDRAEARTRQTLSVSGEAGLRRTLLTCVGRTLGVQGGPSRPRARESSSRASYAQDEMQARRWDDAARIRGGRAPFEALRSLLARLAREDGRLKTALRARSLPSGT